MKILLAITALIYSSIIFADKNEFSGWMTQKGLDNYFEVLNNGDRNSSYFDNGHLVIAAQGRWYEKQINYRVKTASIDEQNISQWYWWINQSHNAFIKKMKLYEEQGLKLVSAQSFLMPDGSARYQGVWHKVND